MALAGISLGSKSLFAKLLSTKAVLKPQVATIVSKVLRDRDYERPQPFDYNNEKFSRLRSLFEKTTWRFDENSKIIVVDGAIGSGKTQLAKELAEQLDMHFISGINFDDIFINKYGYDLRQLNPKLPPGAQYFDINDFLKDPTNWNTTRMQYRAFQMKIHKYLDALVHVLNTGQGVVMDTSVYSDYIFTNTLAKFGFISPICCDYLTEARDTVLHFLMQPHLAIYLDMPVDTILKKVKERNLPAEKNSPFYKPEILAHMEQLYKLDYLKKIERHAEILIYDWSDSGEAEVVVEDIEQIDFDNYEVFSTKLMDWQKEHEEQWQEQRGLYTSNRNWFDRWIDLARSDVPRLLLDGDEYKVYKDVVESSPGGKYRYGFNKDVGDVALLTKL